MDVLYPDVTVELSGEDGNAFVLMGVVTKALRRAGHSDAIESFREEAMSGDYDNLLRTCMKYVNVE